MKKENNTAIAMEEMQQVMNGFIASAGKLLQSAQLSLPNETIPVIQFNPKKVNIKDPIEGKIIFEPTEDYGYLEALGCYHPADNCPEKRKFVLYTTNIRNVAVHYVLKNYSINRSDKNFDTLLSKHFNLIAAFVLCHEISHWLLHRATDANGNTMGKFNYQTADQVFYHEGLAQSLLFAALADAPNFIPINWYGLPTMDCMMSWMETGQPQQYLVYKQMGDDTIRILKAMCFLRQTNIQSFELLEQTLDQIIDNSLPSIDNVMVSFLKRPFTAIFREESLAAVLRFVKLKLPYDKSIRSLVLGIKYGIYSC